MKNTPSSVMSDPQRTQHFLQEFENDFDPVHPEGSKTPVHILGYGEISTVICFDLPGYEHMAYKRLPLFSSDTEAKNYCRLYLEYNERLSSSGVTTPLSTACYVKGHNGLYVAYLGQEKLNPRSIGNKILHSGSEEDIQQLFQRVLDTMISLWRHNQQHPEMLLGLDSQISNWAMKNYSPGRPINTQTPICFIDTSTPFIRKNGIEQMNAELFLQSAPKPFRGLLKKFFLTEIMDRYYDFRLVAIDLAANLYKEQRPDLIPGLIDLVNDLGREFLEGKPISHKEVERYYKEDKFIWKLFLGVRRADRFISTRLLGRRYEFTLPGKIVR